MINKMKINKWSSENPTQLLCTFVLSWQTRKGLVQGGCWFTLETQSPASEGTLPQRDSRAWELGITVFPDKATASTHKGVSGPIGVSIDTVLTAPVPWNLDFTSFASPPPPPFFPFQGLPYMSMTSAS